MAGTLYLGSQKVCPAVILGGEKTVARYVVEDGVAKPNSTELVGNEFDDITQIDAHSFYYAFYYCQNLTGNLQFKNLQKISSAGMAYAFYGTKITSVNFPVLTEIMFGGMVYAFYETGVTSINFPSLIEIGRYGMQYAFQKINISSISFPSLINVGELGLHSTFSQCSLLENVYFPSLTTVGSQGLAAAFGWCSNLENVYFNAMKSDNSFHIGSLQNMIQNCSDVTLHFPSNVEAKVQSLYGYPNFSGINTTILYDLPATE